LGDEGILGRNPLLLGLLIFKGHAVLGSAPVLGLLIFKGAQILHRALIQEPLLWRGVVYEGAQILERSTSKQDLSLSPWMIFKGG